jgi:DNA-nicking Smr family endonuclease
MVRKRLTDEDNILWGRVAATVKPISGKMAPRLTDSVNLKHPILPLRDTTSAPAPMRLMSAPRVQALPYANTLDAGWDRKLAKGLAQPDMSIDLHGETSATAYGRLNKALGDAVVRGSRMLLVVTGKPAVRNNPRLPPNGRGVIRASIADWLSASPHASWIAAVRGAHPRHGGQGALYVIFKRGR